MKRIRKCPVCGAYTLKEYHCVKTISAHPVKFKNIKFLEYIVKAKEEI